MTEEKLHDVLFGQFASDPFDRLNASVLADWYDDAGREDVAAAVRWMLEGRRRPYHQEFNRNNVPYSWWSMARTESQGECPGDPESDIPAEVFDELLGGIRMGYSDVYAWHYPNLHDAMEDLAQALTQRHASGNKP